METLLCRVPLCTSEGCLFTLLWSSIISTNPLVFVVVLPEGLIIGSDACVQFLTHVHTIRRVVILQQGEKSKSSYSGFLGMSLRMFLSALIDIQADEYFCVQYSKLWCLMNSSSRGCYRTTDLMNFPFVSGSSLICDIFTGVGSSAITHFFAASVLSNRLSVLILPTWIYETSLANALSVWKPSHSFKHYQCFMASRPSVCVCWDKAR